MTNELKEKILECVNMIIICSPLAYDYVKYTDQLLAIIDEGIEEELNRCCPRD